MDETYVKVKAQWMYLYRALDSDGATVEFMLSPTRNATSAGYPLGAFFRKALRARHTVAPRVINVDKNPSYPKAVGKLKRKGTLPPGCELRPVKYLNNLVEQDHRFIKRRVTQEWASGRWIQHGGRYKGMRRCISYGRVKFTGQSRRYQQPNPVCVHGLRIGCLTPNS